MHLKVSSPSRCSFKYPSLFVIWLNSNCRPAGTCLYVNSSDLGCQPRLTKELLHVLQRGQRQHVTFAVDHTWQSRLKSACLAGPTPADTGEERVGGGAGREEWQHRCIIHLFIIPCFSPLIIRKPLFFFSFLPTPRLHKCHLSERDWDGAGKKGRIFSPRNLDFICSLAGAVSLGRLNTHKNIDWVRSRQVRSCTPLSHRYRELARAWPFVRGDYGEERNPACLSKKQWELCWQ